MSEKSISENKELRECIFKLISMIRELTLEVENVKSELSKIKELDSRVSKIELDNMKYS